MMIWRGTGVSGWLALWRWLDHRPPRPAPDRSVELAAHQTERIGQQNKRQKP